MTRPITGICLVLLLSACGGGGGIGGTVTPIEGVSYRYVRNSVDKRTVVAFLEDIQYGYPIIRHRSAPTLRMAPDSTSRERRQVANAVRFVNSALPDEFRIRIGSDAPDRQDGVPDGEIWIDFAHLDEWPVDRGSATAHAQYQQYSSDPDDPAFAVHIWLDKTKTDAREDGWNTAFLVHEILHAVGLDGHVNRDRFDSIMSPYIDHPLARPTQPPDLLFPIDKDGIAAVYMLNIGDDPSDLGDWNRYIREFQGTVGPVTFGVD